MKADARNIIEYNNKPICELSDYLKKYEIADCTVIAALSGGVDSVALLVSLNELKDSFNLKIVAVHINHNLRGEESREDSDFCSELSSKLGVQIVIKDVAVKDIAEEKKYSLELAARNIRKEAFYQEAKNNNAKNIFLAHNLEDQVETVLFRIGRGTGIHGLRGMLSFKNEDDFNICRPFINTKKLDLQKMLLDRKIRWREDSSNLSTDFTRNRIRHELYPIFQEIFPGSFPGSLLRLSEHSASLINNLKEITPASLKDALFKSAAGIIIDLKKFSADSFMLGELLRPFFQESFSAYNLPDEQHIRRIYQMAETETGKVIDIDQSVKAMKDRNFLIISENNFTSELYTEYSFSDNCKTDLPFSEADHLLYRELLSCKELSMTYAMQFEDKADITIKYPGSLTELKDLSLGRKKLKKLYSDKSVPLTIALKFPLIYYKNELVLVPGVAGRQDFIVDQGKGISFIFKNNHEIFK